VSGPVTRVARCGNCLRLLQDQPIEPEGVHSLLPSDGGSDYRTIPNVTFTVCNGNEFHDLATILTHFVA
jgi:hypothetical protein